MVRGSAVQIYGLPYCRGEIIGQAGRAHRVTADIYLASLKVHCFEHLPADPTMWALGISPDINWWA